MRIGVYCIYNSKTDNLKDCYVGSTATMGFDKRWQKHIAFANSGHHHSVIFQRAWNKYGQDAFVFSILEECLSNQCLEREQVYLDDIQPRYNICKIAGSQLGMKRSYETRKKMSISHLGDGNHMYGKTTTRLVKQRISQSRRGKCVGEHNGRSKLTNEDVIIIRQLLMSGIRQSTIADQFHVTQGTISKIKTGRKWRD